MTFVMTKSNSLSLSLSLSVVHIVLSEEDDHHFMEDYNIFRGKPSPVLLDHHGDLLTHVR